jgi:hypothetical protein
MRKLIHIVFGVLKTGKPFDPEHERLLSCSACVLRRYLTSGGEAELKRRD